MADPNQPYFDPDLLARLAQASQLPGYTGLAGEQIARGQALQGVPQPGTTQAGVGTVAANPLQHIAAMMLRQQGQKMEQGGFQDLTARLGAATQAGAQRMGMQMGAAAQPNFDIEDLFGPDEKKRTAAAQILSDRIRTQNQLAAMGAPGAADQAKQLQNLGEKAAETRVRFGEEKLASNERIAAIKSLKPTQNNPYGAGIWFNPATGRVEQVGQGFVAPRASGELTFKDLDKNWNTFTSKYTPRLASARSPFGASQGLLDRATRIEQIPENTPLPDLDRRDMEEIASGTAAVITGSNAAARSAVEALVPHTFMGSVNQFIEKIKNEPQGLEQQEFAKKYMRLLAREKAQATARVKNTVAMGLSAYQDTIRNPRVAGKARDWLKTSGLFDDNEINDIMGGAAEPGGDNIGVVPITRKTIGNKTYEKIGDKWYEAPGGQ